MGSLVGGIATCNMGSKSFEKSKEAWSSLVYNKDITQSEVLDAYKDWAVTYENDLLALHPDRAQHMATYLRDLCRAERYDISTIRVLDVAAGSGLVGVELAKVGFRRIVALDYCRMCRRNGFVINSMTLQYSHFVDEYKHIDEYVKE